MFREPYRDLLDRLLSLSYQDDAGHWIWLGERNRDGYGKISMRQNGRWRNLYAHRVSFEHLFGPIPSGHDLDHKPECPRCCIHPNHLTPVPYREHRARTGFSSRVRAPRQLGLWF
jgi:hypothetical protein